MSSTRLPDGLTVGVLQGAPTNRRIFVNMLEVQGGAEVLTTGQPHEAMGMLTDPEVNIFLGEKTLMVGHQEPSLLADLQARSELNPPPIILTGYQFSQQEAIRFIRSGVAGLLILPFQPETLLEKIVAGLRTGGGRPAPRRSDPAEEPLSSSRKDPSEQKRPGDEDVGMR